MLTANPLVNLMEINALVFLDSYVDDHFRPMVAASRLISEQAKAQMTGRPVVH